MASKELISQEIKTLTSSPVDTYRGIIPYSRYSGLSYELFVELISNCRVLDICSGLSGLALESYTDGINHRITSVSPGGARSSFLTNMARDIQIHRRSKLKDRFHALQVAREVKMNVLAVHPADTGLPDSSFDVIFDFYGFNYYSRAMPENLYEMSLLEVFRLLCPHGVFYIRDQRLAQSIRLDDHSSQQYQVFSQACASSGMRFGRIPNTNHTIMVTRENN